MMLSSVRLACLLLVLGLMIAVCPSGGASPGGMKSSASVSPRLAKPVLTRIPAEESVADDFYIEGGIVCYEVLANNACSGESCVYSSDSHSGCGFIYQPPNPSNRCCGVTML